MKKKDIITLGADPEFVLIDKKGNVSTLLITHSSIKEEKKIGLAAMGLELPLKLDRDLSQ